MRRTDVIIGPFRRRAFGEGLAVLLAEEPDLSVTSLDRAQEAEPYLTAGATTIIILEAREDSDTPALLPRSDSVSVIYISQEGRDVQIALRQVDRTRLRAAIDLVAEAPHPKVVALDSDAPAQPPFALPHFRQAETAGLSWVLAWLDAIFCCALQELSASRDGDGAAWLSDLNHLVDRLGGANGLGRDDEAHRFQALIDAPMWQVRLLRTFALDPVEMKLICLAAAPDLDQRYAQAIGLLQANYDQCRPNATTLARLLGPGMVGADISALLAGRRAFARLRMIRVMPQDGPQPGYRVAPALYDLMLGIRRHAGDGWHVQTDALPANDAITDRVGPLLAAGRGPVIYVTGAADEIAAAVIAGGSPILRANCTDDAANRVPDWALRARLLDAALMLEDVDGVSASVQRNVLNHLDDGLVRARIVAGQSAPVTEDGIHIDTPKPSLSLHARRWGVAARDHGLPLKEAAAQHLGGTLKLNLADMAATLRLAVGQDRITPGQDPAEAILQAARRIAASRAPETVRRAPCIFTWDDIILPDRIKSVLRSVPSHVHHGPKVLDDWGFAARLPYGRGVGALFSGRSGTGKTMAAQVIAASLGAELMQVDIARCVSKYIGETEKNIDRCFCAAEAASAVLLFDEADALFGKRTEIKDAHDRHANVEVAYLLQRIEAFEGLVILTTNLKGNIDAAFLRRLRFVCDFPMPDARDRERIWAIAFPDKARLAADVDLAFLARRLPLAGGSIQTIAVNSAFAAAAEACESIHMRHVTAATRAELIKNGMFSAEEALPEPGAPVLEGSLS